MYKIHEEKAFLLKVFEESYLKEYYTISHYDISEGLKLDVIDSMTFWCVACKVNHRYEQGHINGGYLFRTRQSNVRFSCLAGSVPRHTLIKKVEKRLVKNCLNPIPIITFGDENIQSEIY